MVLLKTLRMTNLVKCIGLAKRPSMFLPLTARSTELWLSGSGMKHARGDAARDQIRFSRPIPARCALGRMPLPP